MSKPTSRNPWDWMQPHDAARWGEVINEQARWCAAVMLGGLPYMWNKARAVRDLAYQRLGAGRGDKVLVIGESLKSCGFLDDLRERVGPAGTVTAIDITDEARNAYWAGRRGSGGQLATWRWDYTGSMPDGAFDCVAVLQAVQHADDWHAVGGELLRVMKSGRNIVLTEITYSPQFRMIASLDLHIEYVLDKIFSRIGFSTEDIPYYSLEELMAAFDGLVRDADTFWWKGVQLFWGTKP